MKVNRTEVLRYVVGGILVTAVDLAIYFLLIKGLPFSVAKGISFICAGIVGYLLNKFWTFKQQKKSYSEVGRYWIINAAALGINITINQIALNAWPQGVVIAIVIATIITSVFSYVGFKFWVFHKTA